MKLTLRRSRLMLAYLLMSHSTALLLVFMLDLSPMLTVLSLLIMMASLLFYCRRYGWVFQAEHSAELWNDENGYWFWSDERGNEQGPLQLKSSVISGLLIGIYLRPLNSRFSRSFVIARDSLEPDDWRRLRVRLRDPESWD